MSVIIIETPSGSHHSHEPLFVTLESDRFTGSGPYVPNVDNLMVYLELYVVGGDLITKLQAPYDYNTKQTIIDLIALAQVDHVLPTEASILPHGILPFDFGEAVGVVQQVYFKYADKFGTPAVPETLTDSDPLFLVRGSRSANAGRGAILSAAAEAPFIILHTYLEDNHTSPWNKLVSYNQPDWLYLYTLEDMDLEVKLTMHHTDGTDDEEVLNTLELLANKVYWIQCGIPQLLQIDLIANPDIYAYTLTFTKSGELVGRTQRFEIDDTCQDWGRVLLYTNGRGGIESVHMKGRATHTRQITTGSEVFRRTRWTDFTIKRGDYDSLTPEGNTSSAGSTGFYSKLQAEHMQQLIHSTAWMIRNNKFEKVIIESSSLRVSEDDADLFAIDLTYRIAYDDDAFTR